MNRTGKIAQNVLYTLGTQCATSLLSFVVTLYLPAYLQDTGLGAITLTTSFAGIFGIVTSLGTTTVLIREIARDRSEIRRLLPAAIAMRLLLTPIAVGAGAAVAHLLYAPQIQQLIVLALVLNALYNVNDAVGSALRGLEEFRWLNVATLADKVLASVLTIVLVFVRAPLWSFVAVGVVGCVVSTTMMLFFLRRRSPIPDEAPAPEREREAVWTRFRPLILAGMPFLASALFVQIYGNSAPVLLASMSGIAAVGWFGLAKRLAGLCLLIPVAVTQALLPVLSRLYVEGDEEAFAAAVRRMTRLMLIIVMPFTVILVLAAGPVLQLLHYPDSFRPAVPVLMTMGGALIFWFLSQAIGTALIASDRQAAFGRISGAAAAVSVPLAALCIFATERLWKNGAIGAVLSDMLLEAGMVWAYARALPRGAAFGDGGSVGLRAALAVLPTVGMLYLAPLLGTSLRLAPRSLPGTATFVALAGAGLLLYLPLCWLLRCFQAEDVQLLKRLGLKRPDLFRRVAI